MVGFFNIAASHPAVLVITVINFAFFKSLHMIEYGIFLIFNYRGILNTVTRDKKKAGKIALIITVLYALSDELHQTFVPTREGKFRDIIFDTIGAVFALYFIWNIQLKAPKRLLIWAKKLEII